VRWMSAVFVRHEEELNVSSDSSASEGRSDHPPGESGLTEWWNGVWTALGKKVGLMIFEASCGS